MRQPFSESRFGWRVVPIRCFKTARRRGRGPPLIHLAGRGKAAVQTVFERWCSQSPDSRLKSAPGLDRPFPAGFNGKKNVKAARRHC